MFFRMSVAPAAMGISTSVHLVLSVRCEGEFTVLIFLFLKRYFCSYFVYVFLKWHWLIFFRHIAISDFSLMPENVKNPEVKAQPGSLLRANWLATSNKGFLCFSMPRFQSVFTRAGEGPRECFIPEALFEDSWFLVAIFPQISFKKEHDTNMSFIILSMAGGDCVQRCVAMGGDYVCKYEWPWEVIMAQEVTVSTGDEWPWEVAVSSGGNNVIEGGYGYERWLCPQ